MNIILWHSYHLGDDAIHAAYRQMTALSIASWQRHCPHIDRAIWLDGKAPNVHAMYRDRWQTLYDLWHLWRPNLLLVDPDTLCIRPVEFFDRFRAMRLFNQADISYGEETPYFIGGVCYIPASTPPEVWALGEALAASWKDDWDYLQYIANRMMRLHAEMTGISIEIEPALNFSVPLGLGLDTVQEARVLHFHSSKNALRTLEAMQTAGRRYGLTH